MNLLTTPIVSGAVAGVSFALLLLLLVKGRSTNADPPPAEKPAALASWEDNLPGGKS